MMRGLSYNVVLIGVPLLFWAATKWRLLAAAAVTAWRDWRAARAGLSPGSGPDTAPAAGPQVSPPTAPPGEGLGRASEGGPEEGAGKRHAPVLETRHDGVTGAWIRVERPRGDG